VHFPSCGRVREGAHAASPCREAAPSPALPRKRGGPQMAQLFFVESSGRHGRYNSGHIAGRPVPDCERYLGSACFCCSSCFSC
jgi:hypothetical protein